MKYLCPRDFRRGEMEEYMLVQGLLIGLLATICGGTFIEYLV